jgi:hypothetical protein
MVDRGLTSEFDRSLSSQEGPVWFPVAASLWAPKLGYGLLAVLQLRLSQACCLKFSQAGIQHHKSSFSIALYRRAAWPRSHSSPRHC